MSRDPERTDPTSRPPRRIIWIVGAVLVGLLVLIAMQGLIRGGGEAAGVTEAAPGDDNASPASATVNSDRK